MAEVHLAGPSSWAATGVGGGGWGVLFAQHLLDEGHAIGNMDDIMKVIHITGKGRMLNTLESFNIYKETKAGNQINDRLTTKENKIFEAILQHGPQ